MTRSELVQRLIEKNQYLSQHEAELVVETLFNNISDALSKGDRVELRGLGVFSVKEREKRVARNPRTKENVEVEAKAVPAFKIGKKLHKRLNESNA